MIHFLITNHPHFDNFNPPHPLVFLSKQMKSAAQEEPRVCPKSLHLAHVPHRT